jgi:CRISPR system Cascade subunit CasD
MKTVLLRLCGWQSYGDSSKEVYRHTRNEPTFSAIMGMIGSALGISCENPAFERFFKLSMAIRVLQEGSKEKDYQNARNFITLKKTKRPKNMLTEQTWRFYLANADFLIALTGEDAIIEKVVNAVKSPAYHLYMGRLCCTPTCPVFFALTDYQNPVEALLSIKEYSDLSFSGVVKRLQKKDDLVRIIRQVDEGDFASIDSYDGPAHSMRRVRSEWHKIGE